MDLNTKIQQILIDKSISSSQFADEIGVTRSGISHILTGRNRPSLDLIQKIIVRFPELGTAWILDGEPLPESVQTKNVTRAYNNQPNELYAKIGKKAEPDIVKDKVTQSKISNRDTLGKEKVVERVILFYTDGTFREYSPTVGLVYNNNSEIVR